MAFDPLQSNCAHCGVAAGVECDWSGDPPSEHPRFHSDRLEVEEFSEAIEQGQVDPKEWHDAVLRAAEDEV
jgi:hypothetical protein